MGLAHLQHVTAVPSTSSSEGDLSIDAELRSLTASIPSLQSLAPGEPPGASGRRVGAVLLGIRVYARVCRAFMSFGINFTGVSVVRSVLDGALNFLDLGSSQRIQCTMLHIGGDESAKLGAAAHRKHAAVVPDVA